MEDYTKAWVIRVHPRISIRLQKVKFCVCYIGMFAGKGKITSGEGDIKDR